jgi:hypothetical protein
MNNIESDGSQHTSAESKDAGSRRFSGNRLALFHANAAGTGTAMSIDFRPRRATGMPCMFLELAPQKTPSQNKAGQRIPGTFDWDRKITVKLEFTDVCELLSVMEGVQEQAGGDRRGLYHQNGRSSTMISFQRNAEKGVYWLGLSRKSEGDREPARLNFALTLVEAVGLRFVIRSALLNLAFPAAGAESVA